MPRKKICITAALLYANGPVHLGHLIEYIQADMATRFHRLVGDDVRYLCGSDSHGTPIMLAAQKRGISPEQLIEEVHADHAADMKTFSVEFDHFSTTHSDENQALVETIFKRLDAKGGISRKSISQAFDPEHNMFLPDRYVKGDCPRCGASDQYGDNCEACGASYSPCDLKNAVSVLSGKPPESKSTEHLFFELESHRNFLLKWLESDAIPESCANKLKEWFDDELRAWDISRDAPYFGFSIPGTTDKFFYVWFDAPIGYMAADHQLAKKTNRDDWQADWQPDSDTQLIQFIGKDIMYFHALFWPTVLQEAGFRLPTALRIHGYLTVNGKKMSKSRGTFITAKQYAEQLNPEYLRYYYAAKLAPTTEDVDLNFEDFRQRVNADLVGKFVNIASRCAGFISKHFDGKLASALPDVAGFEQAVAAGEKIAAHYEKAEFAKAMREIMQLADLTNQYIDQQKPWIIAKEKPVSDQVQAIATQGINLFRVLSTYLKPVLPETIKEVELFLNDGELTWESRSTPLLDHTINRFKPLLTRITPEDIEALSAVVA